MVDFTRADWPLLAQPAPSTQLRFSFVLAILPDVAQAAAFWPLGAGLLATPQQTSPSTAKNTEDRALWFSDPKPVPRAAELSPLPEQSLPWPWCISPRGHGGKTPWPEWLRNTGHRSLPGPEATSARCQQGASKEERGPSFWSATAPFSPHPLMVEGAGEPSGASLTRCYPMHEASTFWT